MSVQLSNGQVVNASNAGMQVLTGQANAREILKLMPDLLILRSILSRIVAGELIIGVSQPPEVPKEDPEVPGKLASVE